MNQFSDELCILPSIPSLPASKDEISLKGVRIGTNDESDDDEKVIIQPKKYGNMKIIYDGVILITLGPDYCCFIPTFLLFCVVSYLVISTVQSSISNQWLILITYIVCIGQCIAYLAIATSNPGIVTKQSHSKISDQNRKNCAKCNFRVPKNSRHCGDCGVCIYAYDHHCPWTSKCIGERNLNRFYFFLSFTPIYLIYITIAVIVSMGSNLVNIQTLPKKIMI